MHLGQLRVLDTNMSRGTRSQRLHQEKFAMMQQVRVLHLLHSLYRQQVRNKDIRKFLDGIYISERGLATKAE